MYTLGRHGIVTAPDDFPAWADSGGVERLIDDCALAVEERRLDRGRREGEEAKRADCPRLPILAVEPEGGALCGGPRWTLLLPDRAPEVVLAGQEQSAKHA